jgi:lysophospholipase L1-like esterase
VNPLVIGMAIAVGVGVLLVASSSYSSPRRVLLVGDSLTNGYVWYLKRHAGAAKWLVDHVAIDGAGAEQVYKAAYDRLHSGAYTDVVVLLGVNDLASRRASARQWLGTIYGAAKGNGARVSAVMLTPWACHAKGKGLQDATNELNDWIARSANVDVVIATADLGDASGCLWPDYAGKDGLHMNAAGYATLADIIYERVK